MRCLVVALSAASLLGLACVAVALSADPPDVQAPALEAPDAQAAEVQPAVVGPPEIEATSALVAYGETGEIIWSKRPRLKVPIASITKVMTALLTLDRSDPSEVVTVVPSAAKAGGATVGLEAGEKIGVRDLLEATLIESANDAANALASHVGAGRRKRFVRLMNQTAERLSLTDTTFVRADGLDAPGHESSARDVLLLSREAMENAQFRRLVRLRRARVTGHGVVETTNDLLGVYPGLLGIKTGHTEEAGWSQVVAARRDGVLIYAVILGSPSREQRNTDLRELLDWGFSQYGRVTLVEAGRPYAKAGVPFEEERRLALVADRSVSRVVRFDELLVERVAAPSMIELPVTAGEVRGSVEILKDGEVIAERRLVAAESIRTPNLQVRLGWYARRTLSNARTFVDSAREWLS